MGRITTEAYECGAEQSKPANVLKTANQSEIKRCTIAAIGHLEVPCPCLKSGYFRNISKYVSNRDHRHMPGPQGNRP